MPLCPSSMLYESEKIMIVPISDSRDKLLPELNTSGTRTSVSAKPLQTNQRPRLIGE